METLEYFIFPNINTLRIRIFYKQKCNLYKSSIRFKNIFLISTRSKTVIVNPADKAVTIKVQKYSKFEDNNKNFLFKNFKSIFILQLKKVGSLSSTVS